MSLRALLWAFDQPVYSASKKLVLLALSNFSSDKGLSFPGVETIVQITGQNDKTVRKALSGLVDDAIIVDTGQRTGPNGMVKVYQLPVSERYPKTGSLIRVEDPPNAGSMIPKFGSDLYIGTGNSNKNSNFSGSDKVIKSKELERCTEEIRLIQSSYGDHQALDELDRIKLNRFRDRKKQLEQELGVLV